MCEMRVCLTIGRRRGGGTRQESEGSWVAGGIAGRWFSEEQRKSYLSGMKELPSCKDEPKPLMSSALIKAELFCLISIPVYSCFPGL